MFNVATFSRTGHEPGRASRWTPAVLSVLAFCAAVAPLPASPATLTTPAATAAASGPLEIQAVELYDEAPGMQLEVSTSGELVWTSYRDASGNLVVELPNTMPVARLADVSLAQGMVESAHLEVRDENDGPLTQLVVRTTTEAEHFVAADGSRLVVDLTPVRSRPALPPPVAGATAVEQLAAADQVDLDPGAAVAAATWAATPAPVFEPAPAVGGVDAPGQPSPSEEGGSAAHMYGVDVSSAVGSTVVHVVGDGEFRYSTFTLKNPDRFVLDLGGVVNNASVTQVPVEDDRVRRVRLAQFKQQPDLVARVVVDLNLPIVPLIESTGAGLSLTFAGDAAPMFAEDAEAEAEPSAAPVLEATAFQPAEGSTEGAADVAEAEPASAWDEPAPPVGDPSAALAEAEPAEVEPEAVPVAFEAPVAETFEEPVADSFEAPVEEAFEEPLEETFEEPVEEALAAPAAEPSGDPIEEPAAPSEPAALAAVPAQDAAADDEVVWEEATESSWAEPAAEAQVAEVMPEPATDAPVAAPMPEPVVVAQAPPPAPEPEPWAEPAEPVAEPSYGYDEPVAAASPMARSIGSPEKTYEGEPITMSLKDSDIKDVLRTFAQLSGLNIVVQPGVSGSVTVELTEVPWDQALEQVLKINGLDYELEGSIMRIAPVDQLRAEAEEQQRLRAAKAMSIPLRTIVRRVSYAEAAQVANVLASGGGASIMSQRGSVVVDRRTNTLIIKELPNFIDSVIAIIEQLDIPEPQVMIEARIIETTKRFSRTLGIDWDFNGLASPATGNTTGLQFPNQGSVDGGVRLLTGARNGFLDISLGNVLNTFSLDAILQAAETEGLINILSAPKITTLNNEKASIQSGLQIPIQTIANNTVSVQFVNATLRLDVTPHVTAEGTVLMDINIQKREPQLAFAVVGASNAPISTKDAKTRVIVRDGGTTVIGGIYQVSSDQGEDRVPGLASIPILGHLFKNKRRDDENEELLIFITPRVVKL